MCMVVPQLRPQKNIQYLIIILKVHLGSLLIAGVALTRTPCIFPSSSVTFALLYAIIKFNSRLIYSNLSRSNRSLPVSLRRREAPPGAGAPIDLTASAAVSSKSQFEKCVRHEVKHLYCRTEPLFYCYFVVLQSNVQRLQFRISSNSRGTNLIDVELRFITYLMFSDLISIVLVVRQF